jgi:hypothetical protein
LTGPSRLYEGHHSKPLLARANPFDGQTQTRPVHADALTVFCGSCIPIRRALALLRVWASQAATAPPAGSVALADADEE